MASATGAVIKATQQFAKSTAGVSIVKELMIGLSLGLAAGSVWKVCISRGYFKRVQDLLAWSARCMVFLGRVGQITLFNTDSQVISSFSM